MTDALAPLRQSAEQAAVTAFLYLAFLGMERARMFHELFPDLGKGDDFMVPFDE